MTGSFYSDLSEVTPSTLAILPRYGVNGDLVSYVLEEQGEYLTRYAPTKMIERACKFFGSSLKGRQIGTHEICGITHKVPISIDPSSGMYMFPTLSPINPKCVWIAHTHISKLRETANQCTEVMFKNGKNIIVDVSYGSMINQVNRTAQFRYLLDERIKQLRSPKGHGDNPDLSE